MMLTPSAVGGRRLLLVDRRVTLLLADLKVLIVSAIEAGRVEATGDDNAEAIGLMVCILAGDWGPFVFGNGEKLDVKGGGRCFVFVGVGFVSCLGSGSGCDCAVFGGGCGLFGTGGGGGIYCCLYCSLGCDCFWGASSGL